MTGQTWTLADVPRPPTMSNSNGTIPAHAEVGPVLARRISDLMAALVELEKPDPNNQEAACYAVPLGDGVIAIYAEECVSDDDPRDGLVGWVQQIDTQAWSFAGYVREKRKRRSPRKAAS